MFAANLATVSVQRGVLLAIRLGPEGDDEGSATVCCKVLLALCVGLGLPSLAVACGGDDGEAPSEVVLVTHDSFAISDDVKAAFERESGLTLRILQSGDASEM